MDRPIYVEVSYYRMCWSEPDVRRGHMLEGKYHGIFLTRFQQRLVSIIMVASSQYKTRVNDKEPRGLSRSER
jgi:hypothetical protein